MFSDLSHSFMFHPLHQNQPLFSVTSLFISSTVKAAKEFSLSSSCVTFTSCQQSSVTLYENSHYVTLLIVRP